MENDKHGLLTWLLGIRGNKFQFFRNQNVNLVSWKTVAVETREKKRSSFPTFFQLIATSKENSLHSFIIAIVGICARIFKRFPTDADFPNWPVPGEGPCCISPLHVFDYLLSNSNTPTSLQFCRNGLIEVNGERKMRFGPNINADYVQITWWSTIS